MKKLDRHAKYLLAIGMNNSLSALISAGYSLSDLISAGYSASDLRSAGYSASDLRSAGYSLSDLRSAGYSASDLRSAGYSASDFDEFENFCKKIPVIKNLYSTFLKELNEKKRIYKQSTWGDIQTFEEACKSENNICETPMCMAGHFVNIAGEDAYKLKNKYNSWVIAAQIIHQKAHPDLPPPNFNSANQEWGMAYIKEMAEIENKLIINNLNKEE